MSKSSERLLISCAIACLLISLGLVVGSHFLDLFSEQTGTDEFVHFHRYIHLLTVTALALTGLFGLLLLWVRVKRTREYLQRQREQIEAFSRANQLINQALDVNTVLRNLVEAALKLTGAADGAAGLFENGQMVFREYYKDGTWVPIDYSFPAGYGVPGWVIENKRPYLSNDTVNDLQVTQEIREKLGFYNLLDTPIINAHGELLGCFEIHNTEDRRPFGDQDITLLQGLSASGAIALENARIIAEQQESARKAKESENNFRSLFDNSPNSLWEEDFSDVKLFIDDIRRQGVSDFSAFFHTNPEAAVRCARMVKVANVNQTTVELYDARTKSDLLDNLNLIFTEASYEPFIEGVIELANGATTYKATGINKTLGGEEIEVNIRASIMPGCEESWEKVIVAMNDITREREIDRLKNEFISTAAHELRTPLTVIMGYSDLLLEHLETSEFNIEQKREFLQSINAKVGALERIVEDLLDVSKIESGRPLLLEKAPTRLYKLLREQVRNHQRETSRHRISNNFDDESLLLMIDGGRINQVLDNLLSNAIKYSPEGGEIAIHVSSSNGQIEISVSDQGLGMTPEQTARVFDKFYRVDTSDTALGGLGLGMSIAKSIVEAHGGQIEVESTPGAGTTVRFSLPLQSDIGSYFTQEVPGTSVLH